MADGAMVESVFADILPAGHRPRVAIVGYAASREQAPWDDHSWEIWTLNDAWSWAKRATRWFEVHSRFLYEWVGRRPAGHVRQLAQFPGPVYMLIPDERIPNAVRYPLEAVIATLGRPYLTSGIAYMVALAIHENAREIGIWGVEMATGSEYAHQRPGCEWLLGFAAARGITVTLPEGCNLLSGPLYAQGFLNPGGERLTTEQIDERIDALEAERDNAAHNCEIAVAGVEQLRGHVAECRVWLSDPPVGVPGHVFNDRLTALDGELDKARRDLVKARGYFDQIEGALQEAQFWKHATPAGGQPARLLSGGLVKPFVTNNGHDDAPADGPRVLTLARGEHGNLVN